MMLISFGTRPEYIKIKPLLATFDGQIPYALLFTGQHMSLLEEVISTTDVRQLQIQDGENRLDSIVSSIMNNNQVFRDIDSVMVQGDTTSAFAVALAAFHRRIKVVHLEAGLRTYNLSHPYPEDSTGSPLLEWQKFTYVLQIWRPPICAKRISHPVSMWWATLYWII